MSKTYRVVWEIDIDASDPLTAACKALAIQRDPDSDTTHFIVREIDGGGLGEPEQIDAETGAPVVDNWIDGPVCAPADDRALANTLDKLVAAVRRALVEYDASGDHVRTPGGRHGEQSDCIRCAIERALPEARP